MLTTDKQRTFEKSSDLAKLKPYRLIGEGYKALQEGRVSTLDQVRKSEAIVEIAEIDTAIAEAEAEQEQGGQLFDARETLEVLSPAKKCQ